METPLESRAEDTGAPTPEAKFATEATAPAANTAPEVRAPALYDLPIFAWAWREDGRDLRA